ncbi:MAG: tyrosine-type recombinase/integrase [Nitriliruptor sp.]
MSDVTVTVLEPSVELRLHRLTGAFLAGYRNANTRTSYLQQLRRWFAWCAAHQIDPLDVERTHVELYMRWFERQVGSINTVCHGISVLAAFYRWLVQTGLLDTTPIAAVRRPSRDETPRHTRLTRHELADWLNAAETVGGSVHAMACLLLLNGLRVSEVCGIDIDDLAEERWHHTVIIHGKGDKDATVPLAPRTRAAIEQATGDRDEGPLLLNQWGNRMSRNNAAAAVATLAAHAGITKRMTPHTLRHAAITAALNAGAHLRDVQDFARHADPKTTMRYDRNRHSLDRHATYAIAQYIAGSE